uniref:BTB domain-containing protein n=1 Tax=Panagrolaimus sp. ES5 TaxID=591445 RepID=A0AC34F445_9BILA
MESNKNDEVINSRKSSFCGSTLSKSSSFTNVEDITATLGEGTRWISTDNTDFGGSNSPLPSSFGSASDISEAGTVVDSDSGENNYSSVTLRELFFDALQDIFKKQDPKNPLFDNIFLVENKEIYTHMLILHLCGAKKLIKYIEKNGSGDRVKKIDMNNIEGNHLTYDEMYIFTKSLYFNNVENDLTATNVMQLLSLGKTFGVKSLVNDCTIYLNSKKWEDDALVLLEKANSFLDVEIIQKCLEIISKTTEKYLFSPKFLVIKHATLVQLLKQRIFKTDAKTLFDKVIDWATKNACVEKDDSIGSIYRETLGEALNLIPFEEMTPDQIFEIDQPNPDNTIVSASKADLSSQGQTTYLPIEEVLKKRVTKYLFKAME